MLFRPAILGSLSQLWIVRFGSMGNESTTYLSKLKYIQGEKENQTKHLISNIYL